MLVVEGCHCRRQCRRLAANAPFFSERDPAAGLHLQHLLGPNNGPAQISRPGRLRKSLPFGPIYRSEPAVPTLSTPNGQRTRPVRKPLSPHRPAATTAAPWPPSPPAAAPALPPSSPPPPPPTYPTGKARLARLSAGRRAALGCPAPRYSSSRPCSLHHRNRGKHVWLLIVAGVEVPSEMRLGEAATCEGD